MNDLSPFVIFDAFGSSFLIVVAVLYIYMSIALMIMATKTGTTGAWLAWFPPLNLYLMTKIAGKSGAYIILLFLPLINIFFFIILWVEMAKARDKPGWTGLLIFIPPINFFIPAYLAMGPGQSRAKNSEIASHPPSSAPPSETKASNVCRSCGAKIAAQDRFCGECGQAVKTSAKRVAQYPSKQAAADMVVSAPESSEPATNILKTLVFIVLVAFSVGYLIWYRLSTKPKEKPTFDPSQALLEDDSILKLQSNQQPSLYDIFTEPQDNVSLKTDSVLLHPLGVEGFLSLDLSSVFNRSHNSVQVGGGDNASFKTWFNQDIVFADGIPFHVCKTGYDVLVSANNTENIFEIKGFATRARRIHFLLWGYNLPKQPARLQIHFKDGSSQSCNIPLSEWTSGEPPIAFDFESTVSTFRHAAVAHQVIEIASPEKEIVSISSISGTYGVIAITFEE